MYAGPLAHLSGSDAAQFLGELIGYFGLEQRSRLAPPPFGLPGERLGEVDQDVLALLRLGGRYLAAIACGRPRRQQGLYDDADRLIQAIVDGAIDAHDENQSRAVGLSGGKATRRPRPRQEKAQQSVYFIGSPEGRIKIGIARDPDKRRRDLQTAHGVELKLLAVTEGGREAEWRYHRRFAAHRLRGEWFKSHRSILAEIERLTPTLSLIGQGQ